MSPAGLGDLPERLSTRRWSWAVDDVPTVVADLGLRVGAASRGEIELQDQEGEKVGEVLLDDGGSVDAIQVRVTEIVDPDDAVALDRLVDDVVDLIAQLERRLGPAQLRTGPDRATWLLDGARLELKRLFTTTRLVLVRDAEAHRPAASTGSDGDSSWSHLQVGLVRLLDALQEGEVVGLAPASGDRFFLEVGRVPGELWLLAFGPAVPGQELAALGFHPPDGEKKSWWQSVELPADPLHLEMSAGLVVAALRHMDGVKSVADLGWTALGLTDQTREKAERLGLRRRGQEDGRGPAGHPRHL